MRPAKQLLLKKIILIPHCKTWSFDQTHRTAGCRYWSEESAEREKEKEKESAAVIPTLNTGSTTATSTAATTTGPERRR